MFQDISSKKKFFKIFLTDRKISSPINYMIWWGIFSISQKIFEKNFFAWNVLKHKVKPKNSRNSTFFQKLKFSPLFLKNTCKFSSPKCSLWYVAIFPKGKSQGPLTFFHGNRLFSADGWKPIKSRLKADGWKAGFL